LTSMGKGRESRGSLARCAYSGRRSRDEGCRFNTNSNMASHRDIEVENDLRVSLARKQAKKRVAE
jgi:hypothetical protein